MKDLYLRKFKNVHGDEVVAATEDLIDSIAKTVIPITRQEGQNVRDYIKYVIEEEYVYGSENSGNASMSIGVYIDSDLGIVVPTLDLISVLNMFYDCYNHTFKINNGVTNVDYIEKLYNNVLAADSNEDAIAKTISDAFNMFGITIGHEMTSFITYCAEALLKDMSLDDDAVAEQDTKIVFDKYIASITGDKHTNTPLVYVYDPQIGLKILYMNNTTDATKDVMEAENGAIH